MRYLVLFLFLNLAVNLTASADCDEVLNDRGWNLRLVNVQAIDSADLNIQRVRIMPMSPNIAMSVQLDSRALHIIKEGLGDPIYSLNLPTTKNLSTNLFTDRSGQIALTLVDSRNMLYVIYPESGAVPLKVGVPSTDPGVISEVKIPDDIGSPLEITVDAGPSSYTFQLTP